MIDLHSHILPSVDDGAQSWEISLAMLDEYAQIGFTTVVATPHWGYPTDETYQRLVKSTFEELREAAESRNIRLLLGRECMLPPDPATLYEDASLTINGSRFVLVELPLSTRPLFLKDSIFGLQTSGKIVILAHPERYRFIQQDWLLARDLIDLGVLFQINIGSLKGTFGKSAKHTAEHLLTEGMVHIASTDAHSNGERLQAVTQGLGIIRNIVGEDGCRSLIHHNPKLVLENSIPNPVTISAKPQSILSRWLGRLLG